MHIIFLFKVLEGVPVTDILTENSTFDRKRVVSVETPYGSIKTKHVVNCTGVWANYCAAMVIITTYRVTQQCCPGGNRPETPRRPSAGGLRIFWAKSLVISAIYTKFKLIAHKCNFEFCIYGWNYQ